MNYKKRHIRRRLVLFVASVLPLFADDVVVPPQPLKDDGDGARRHVGDEDDNDDVYLSLPQHVFNLHVREQQQQQQQQEHYETANEAADKYRIFHRKYMRGNQQWVEQVRLPTQFYNGSIMIPFYPFALENDVIDTTIDGTSAPLPWNTTNHNHDGMKVNRTNDISSEPQRVESHKDRIQENETIITTDSDTMVTETSQSDSPTKTTTTARRVKHVEVDYASKSAGAVILDSSPNFQGVSNLLQQDRDKYAIVPCDESTSSSDTTLTTEPKYVVLGLSEDILVKQFAIANYERYSSHMKEIRLYGSVSTNAIRQQSHWIHLGDFTAKPNTNNSEKQTFDLLEPTWARYLKVEFISHYGDEYYCTISQISVHGSTVLQGFHEQWNEENNENTAESTETARTTSDTTKSAVENVASTPNQIDAPQEKDTTPLVGTKSSNLEVDATNVHTAADRSDKSSGSTLTTTVPTNQRYNFSRVTGCRSSLSFEENLRYYTSQNKNISELFDSSTNGLSTTLSSRPSRSSFTNLCSSTTKTGITPKRSIRKVQVRHAPRQQEESTNMLPRQVGAPNQQNKQLSKLSRGLERVTDFLRNAIEGFNASKMTNNLLHLNEPGSTNEENDERLKSNDGIHDIVTESDFTKSENVNADDHNDVEDLLELNGMMVAKLLKRLPSANCLQNLNFAEYKSNLKTTSSKLRNGSSGGSQTAGSGSSSNAGSNMEPIFKKLTDEIKTLQSNVAIHDQFAIESVSCYQRVMFEMLSEMESDRRSFVDRITKLEDEIQLTSIIVASQRWMLRMISSVLNYCITSIHALQLLKQFGMTESSVSVQSFVKVLLAFITTVVSLYLIILVRRRRNRSMVVVNTQHEINIVKDNTISFQYANHNTSEDDDDSSAEILPLSPIEHPLMKDKETDVLEQ